MRPRRLLAAAGAAVLAASFAAATPAGAIHTWAGWHWARTSNPVTLALGDNVSAVWDSYLATTSTDWSAAAVADTPVTAGTAGKSCRARAGRVEVCNARYGSNGWLGLATIWGAGDKHITQATVKLNDTYFAKPAYNTTAWRNSVMCQEVGHTLGLAHNDEDFNTTIGTCMDYSNDPTLNQHPNQHDFDMLDEIYAHADSTTTAGAASATGAATSNAGSGNSEADWGRAIRHDSNGRPSVYAKDLGNGNYVFNFVFWADGSGHDQPHVDSQP